MPNDPNPVREIRFESSHEFPSLLEQAGVSLLVSTYQAGKLVVLGSKGGKLSLSVHNFEQAMGVAVHPKRVAVGTRTQIWFLESTPEIVPALPAQGEHDGCFLTRSCHVTDDIHVHEMAWCRDELWFVNTRFSCLCTLQSSFSFVPRWRPRFVSELAAEDRCHLNGLCMDDEGPRFVTAMSETNSPGGWRGDKARAGCVIDVTSGETICRGLAMPHSPRLHRGQLWVLDSGRGQVAIVDRQSGTSTPVCGQQGYTRGLDFAGPLAFVGLSKIRETSTFGGVPIAEHRDSLKCGVAILDAQTGRHLAHFEFVSGVDEIFDVRVLPFAKNPLIAGPMAAAEGAEPIWYVPLTPPTPGATDWRSQPRPPASASPIEKVRLTPALESNTAVQLYREGMELAEADHLVAALECFDRAIRIDPGLAEAHCNRGVALQMLGRFAESAQALRQAKKLNPELPAAHINLAMTLFLSGDYHEAWPEYEWRWQRSQIENRPLAAAQIAPPWRGEALDGKSLLVYGEQGIGDEIMFASFAPTLLRSCRQLILGCADRLVALFRRSFPAAIVVPAESLGDPAVRHRLGPIDLQVAMGSVPGNLKWDPVTAIPNAPFLRVDASLRQAWQDRLASLQGLRTVGISWRGGKEPLEIRRRSTSLSDWRPLVETPGLAFINLQYGVRAEELAEFQSLYGKPLHFWPQLDPLQDIDDFAALMTTIDQVVSIDNSTIHLAGALGIPTWAFVTFPSASYWRWFGTGETTPWYSSLRLVRRFAPESWREIMQRVASKS